MQIRGALVAERVDPASVSPSGSHAQVGEGGWRGEGISLPLLQGALLKMLGAREKGGIGRYIPFVNTELCAGSSGGGDGSIICQT